MIRGFLYSIAATDLPTTFCAWTGAFAEKFNLATVKSWMGDFSE